MSDENMLDALAASEEPAPSENTGPAKRDLDMSDSLGAAFLSQSESREGAILDVSGVRPGLLLAGGLVLAWMGVGMVRLARQGFDATVTDTGAGSPLWTGIALTGANPYFLVWWVTVGAALLVRAADFGAMGLLMFAIAHWLCDLGWLWFMSAAAFGGTRWLGARFSRIVHAVCGGFLLLAALDFLIDGTRQVMALFGNGGASL